MWTISESIALFILFLLAIRDVQTRKISLLFLFACGGGSIIYHIVKREINVWLILAGILVGAVFILISKVTNEGIGYGDSIGILILGGFLGFWRLLTVMSLAFFLLICVLIPLMIRVRMSRKLALPFYPFLAGGYLCLLLLEGMRR